MKLKLYSFLFASLLIMVIGCKTASKLYQKGDYNGAVMLAVKELQKKPGDPERIALVKSAYTFAINDHESKIRNYHSSSNELKWEWVYHEYLTQQQLYTAIQKSPLVFEIIHPVDYSNEVITYSEKAGDIRKERGLRWMEHADRESAKLAYREFQTALCFKPGDFEIENMRTQAFDAAVTRVVILPATKFGFMYSTFNYELRQFSEDVIHNMKQNNANEFVQFYSEWDTPNRDIVPDHIVEMSFDNLNIGRTQERKSTREVTKEVVIKEIVYKPDSIIKEYGNVKARITTTHQTLYAAGFLRIQTRDINSRHLWGDNIGSSYTWTSEFSTYSGDERALSEQDKLLVNRIPPAVPHDSEIVRILKNNIYNDLLDRLKIFYNRY